MCGISGLVRFGPPERGPQALFKMLEVQHHRGPDGCAYLQSDGVCLGHNRLKIIDLTDNALQPMPNEDRTLWMVFNGEIYNFKELRKDLEEKGHTFRSQSDGEVLLHLYEEEKQAMVHRLNGIFAFALFDTVQGKLLLARDHFGVKPLYYARESSRFLFASEIKALLAGGTERTLSTQGLNETILFATTAGRNTLFSRIHRLLPGETLLLDTRTGESTRDRYWVPTMSEDLPQGDPVERIHGLLQEAVGRQLVSDVPVGTMCSGGIDSSLISALATRHAGCPLDTYVVQVDDPRFNEVRYAALVSDHIHSNHHVLETRAEQADQLLPLAIWLHDEPLLHENSIPILQISLLAKNQVTVLLSGEGADELYGGYSNQKTYRTIHRLKRFVPAGVAALFEPLAWRLPTTRPARLLQRLASADAGEALVFSASRTSPVLLKHLGLDIPASWSYRSEVASAALRSTSDPVLAHILYDQQTYLQTLLDRQDKMSMGASIECRVPFLDPLLAEAVNRMGLEIRHHQGQDKWILRQIGRNYLPAEIFNRPKHPFGLPLGPWLRGSSLLSRTITSLASGNLAREGYLPRKTAESILRMWEGGNDSIARLVWSLASLEIWWDIFLAGKPPDGLEILPSRRSLERVANPYRVAAAEVH